jgi:hypothetical protein
VLDKKGATTLQDWVNKYTTHYDQSAKEVEGKGYILNKVTNVSNDKIGAKNVIQYSTDTVSAGKADGVLVASDKYIFVLIGLSGKAEDVRKQMAESLTF